jgi:hypothetical protein
MNTLKKVDERLLKLDFPSLHVLAHCLSPFFPAFCLFYLNQICTFRPFVEQNFMSFCCAALICCVFDFETFSAQQSPPNGKTLSVELDYEEEKKSMQSHRALEVVLQAKCSDL